MNVFAAKPLISLIALLLFCKSFTYAQDGDQILDGIGETGLIARYIFDGNTKDWSRNNLHATLKKSDASFVLDETFKNTLSLSKGNYVSLPSESLNSIESLSITSWVYLNSNEKNVYLFDFGSAKNAHFFAKLTGESTKYLETALVKNATLTTSSQSPAPETKKWVHLAFVIDIPSQSFSTYINGTRVATTKTSDLDLDSLFSSDANKLFIGNALTSGQKTLDARLYDLRLYRIPLSANQVGRIYQNSIKTGESVVNERAEPEDNLPIFENDIPQLYNQYLTAVSDVTVETVVGQLPRLPRYVAGTHKIPVESSQVRVLWPAPDDNSSVLKFGTYKISGRVPGTNFKPTATVFVKENKKASTPDLSLASFQLNEVSLDVNTKGQDSKFIENRNKFINTLASTNPDSFLYMFRNAFGQQQPAGAEPLGVWDTQETKLRGHATGHYLTAIAQAYASTNYDKALHQEFENKMNYMVETLYALSQLSGKPKNEGSDFVSDPSAVPPGPGKSTYNSDLSETGIRTDYWNWGTGYISAYPPDQFIMLESGAKYGGQDDRVWAPYYTLHKIVAGLIDIYEVSGNEKALNVAEGMAEWVYTRLSKLPTETLITMWNTYIAGEFGGINESLAHLYRITGKPEYLKAAQLFDNIKVFYGDAQHTHGLAKNVDTYRGLHANQHIPQIMGALELYRNSESPEYYHIADNFWYKTKNDYMYSIGGVAGARNPANAECFVAQPATLYENGLSAGGQNETCGTYNMLKLTRGLFFYNQQPELMDYYERALYNQILASVAEDSPANTYHIPLRPGSKKQFSNADMSGFTCCNGTALESSTKLQNSIYFKSIENTAVFVNLFVPSTLKWTDKGITIKQETDFPHSDHTKLRVRGSGAFSLNIRIPSWAKKEVEVKINGKPQDIAIKAGSYLNLYRSWKDGDLIELKMPFSFHLDPIMDQENIASLFYGPVLLAAQESEPRTTFRKVTLNASDLGKTITGKPEKLEFKIDGTLYKPFYETYNRHSVYLDVTLE